MSTLSVIRHMEWKQCSNYFASFNKFRRKQFLTASWKRHRLLKFCGRHRVERIFQIKIGLVEFPETITQQNMVEVAGECVAGASTYDGSQPTLSCSSQGRWFSSQQLISTCVCKKSHSTYHGKCVLQGNFSPLCILSVAFFVLAFICLLF